MAHLYVTSMAGGVCDLLRKGFVVLKSIPISSKGTCDLFVRVYKGVFSGLLMFQLLPSQGSTLRASVSEMQPRTAR